MSKLTELMQAIGYSFEDPALLKLALVHPSRGAINNQRLEYLGDAVLELCMSDLLFRAHPQATEGQLTRMRASLVCESALLYVAEALKLDNHVKANPPLAAEVRGRASIMADAVEAVLAAIYLDGGLSAAAAFVTKWWQEQLIQAEGATNYKNRLQELFQADHLPEPGYHTVAESGPAHRKRFIIAVSGAQGELARAEGTTKKQAEQEAARLALNRLQGESGIE